ncbi:MAG: VOC family protein [Kangiellaceae bacterium]|nr:VOC family protein [Kangiellaceae bacterium]
MKSPLTLLVVKDLKESLQFYTEVLGLKLIENHSDCIKLKVEHHEVIMFQGTMNSIKYSHGYNANSTLLFTVEHLDQKISQLKSKGAIFIHETPNENRWGRYSAFKDPSGIVHELFEFNT